MFWFKKRALYITNFVKLWLIGNRTSCRPIRSVVILEFKILLITRIIRDRIGLRSDLLPLLIIIIEIHTADDIKAVLFSGSGQQQVA